MKQCVYQNNVALFNHRQKDHLATVDILPQKIMKKHGSFAILHNLFLLYLFPQ